MRAFALVSVFSLVAARSVRVAEQAPLVQTIPEEPIGWYDPRLGGGRLLDVRRCVWMVDAC